GQAVLDGLAAHGKDPKTAVVVYVGGDPADGNAKMFHDGAVSVLEPAGVKPAAESPGFWDGPKSAAFFEQALTSLGGKVDGVWSANDTNAGGVISILAKNGLAGQVAVSGQDASVEGLRNVLLGYQTATVYKPVSLEADAAAEVAIAILKGETPSADKTLDDGTPYIAVAPILVGPDKVQSVVEAGDAKAADLCSGDTAEACAKYGVK
ncbi:MAG: substrate-binding domain-containing protein, partial [Microbacteriaceae bacterium]|nr:substrate-binding domain-containing protein [Microbacteriaceae bacterium]